MNSKFSWATDNQVWDEQVAKDAEEYLSRYYNNEITRLWRTPGVQPPNWYNHRSDLFCWKELRNSFWIERGVYSREVMKQGDKILSLCCGDGFYEYYFYSTIASQVDGIDRDPTAIKHARKWHSLPNIQYAQADICNRMAIFPYDVVVWDMAMEHFSEPQIDYVLEQCKITLGDNGILCGSTILTEVKGLHPEHQHEFRTPEELESKLRQHFQGVKTFKTSYPERDTVYFRAGNLGRCIR